MLFRYRVLASEREMHLSGRLSVAAVTVGMLRIVPEFFDNRAEFAGAALHLQGGVKDVVAVQQLVFDSLNRLTNP